MTDRNPDSPGRSTGGCQCGAVRYAVAGDPEEVSVCHCRMCQKAGGGPFLALARFPIAAVTWTRGTPAIFASSNLATRGFCPACGTPLTYQWRHDAMSLTTGSFDDPGSIVPTTRFGMEAVLPWSEHLSDMPGESADGFLAAATKQPFVNYQHPDHETRATPDA